MMNDTANTPAESKLKKARFITFGFIMPVVAVLIAFWLVLRAMPEYGPEIELIVPDAQGLTPKTTKVRYRGIDIGEVTSVRLADDYENAIVSVQLYEGQDRFAQAGAEYWIVRPEFRLNRVSGLNTIISGRYIATKPGDGETTLSFNAVDEIPVSVISNNDLKITLFSTRAESVSKGTSIFYRDIEIGFVQNVRLSQDSTHVLMETVVYQKYNRLVRKNSIFWTGRGLDMNFSLMEGFKFDMENLQSVLSSRINMATPDDYGERADSNTMFLLSEEPDDRWSMWDPKIQLGPGGGTDNEPGAGSVEKGPE